jgi:hypothetical protein
MEQTMKDSIKMLADTSSVTVNMLQKMIDINTGFSTALLCQNVEMLNIIAESGVKQMQLLTRSRTTQDFLLGQSRNLQDFSRKTTNNTLITTEIMSSTKVQVENLLNNLWKEVLEPCTMMRCSILPLVK